MKMNDKNLWDSLNKRDDSYNINKKCTSEILLAGYIDNNLSNEENSVIENHILSCDKCLEIIKAIKCEETIDFKINETVTENMRLTINKAIKPKNIKFTLNKKIFAIAATIICVSFLIILSSINKPNTNPGSEKLDINRIVQLYNNNKYYRIDLNSKDGFSPETSFVNRAISTYHPADENKDGKISMNEVLKHISFEKKENQIVASQ